LVLDGKTAREDREGAPKKKRERPQKGGIDEVMRKEAPYPHCSPELPAGEERFTGNDHECVTST